MNMQLTSRIARLGSRLAAIGRQHRELSDRITDVANRPVPDQLVLKRLKHRKLRLKNEMRCYEGLLRSLSNELAT